jgi:hypothetical protein
MSSRLVRAGLLTGISDGLFSTVLVTFFYGSTPARLWQGVASTVGASTVWVGLLMHFGVAFGWSAVFLFVVLRAGWVRSLLASPYGTIKVAALYGPFVWLVMSLVVIPILVHHAPAISFRWWVQLIGHFPFVGLPIVASINYQGLPRGPAAS